MLWLKFITVTRYNLHQNGVLLGTKRAVSEDYLKLSKTGRFRTYGIWLKEHADNIFKRFLTFYITKSFRVYENILSVKDFTGYNNRELKDTKMSSILVPDAT